MLILCLAIVAVLAVGVVAAEEPPFRLHPDNPHYFLFRGRPTVLITSAEHYGAVLNLDFDYVKYLDTLRRDGMNHTRLFTGVYCEPAGAFQIAGNTLAPAGGRLICPWARSAEPGYANGGNKFDLSRWDEAYFARLRDFVEQASARGIVIEVNLFCPFYEDSMWELSPMHPRNNAAGLGPPKREEVYTLTESGGLLALQEALVRKLVAELAPYDNLYYELMNEPYICHVPLDWQYRIADVIVAAESDLLARHLISQNIANLQAKVEAPHAAVSVLNFHYAFPPATVAMNYGLDRALGDNETGFKGTGDDYYRREAWAFILAGGGLYNNLDYSFTVGHEDGSFAYPETQPGGGGRELRRQLRVLAEFMQSLQFVRMRPAPEVLSALPEGTQGLVLAEAGKQYACYLYREPAPAAPAPQTLRLHLPAGSYRGEWVAPVTGEKSEVQVAQGGEIEVTTPPFGQDLALRLVAE